MNKKILIVRGDRREAKALSFLLAGSGYQISTPASASEAVEVARHQQFDLAITDESVPENQPDLSFVTNLKEAQPALPIFLLAQEQNLETVINCIRAGVTEVINNPKNLRQVIECTNGLLRSGDRPEVGDEVTWEDILEVERLLEGSLAGGGTASSTSSASSPEASDLKEKLSKALSERDKISGELAHVMASLEKSKRLIEELKGENGNQSTNTEIAERTAELDTREQKLKEMSAKIAAQKVEVETQMAELEAQQIELEEAQKEARDNPITMEGAISSEALEEERSKFNTMRLDYEARIQDLERELQVAKTKASSSEEQEQVIADLRESLQDAKESISEKDFIIEQRDRELETLREQVEKSASLPEVEAFEQEKRLLEIERHKLKEKIEQFEDEKRKSEETHQKQQREIQVERRDAEVSLRELQNSVKEEQLKLKVDQATLKEEMRQFEQARQNFQEDVQELQSKQAELRKMESYLNQMQENLKEGTAAIENALPKPDSETAFEPFQATSIPAPAASSDPASEGGPAPTQASNPQGGDPAKPDSWGKPDLNKKSGRGPLRIGRRSSF